MAEILGLTDVRKSVRLGETDVEILHGLTFQVEAGEFVALMGASGSGKSTLLNLVGLLDRPSSGTVRLLGRDVSQLSEDEQAETRSLAIGFVFQAFHLLPYLTARQNVALAFGYAGRPEARGKAGELLERVGLGHRGDAYPTTLSGGERQRVAIARALANDPKLILADEPTGALDSATGSQILQLVAELHHRGATVLMITHDEAVARRAERVLTLRDGRLG